jgi:lipopolysaccharide/colanic/teichoic acid biosynthesis glycosyltransferase
MRQGASISIRASTCWIVECPMLNRIGNWVVKQLVDIISVSIGLLLSLPIIAVFDAIVYAESPSLIFYRQRRLGRNRKSFDIVKVCNVRLGLAKDRQIGWAIPHPPPCLKMGAFVRKWNVDEMPRFWNVRKDEMGLIGPRPKCPQQGARFNHGMPYYNACHRGQTGNYRLGTTVCVATFFYANARMLDRKNSQRGAKRMITCESLKCRSSATNLVSLFIRRNFLKFYCGYRCLDSLCGSCRVVNSQSRLNSRQLDLTNYNYNYINELCLSSSHLSS